MHAFKLDENFPVGATEMLAAAGFDASDVRLQKLQGKPDSEIARVCTLESRCLITLDLDFANILAYPPSAHAGIIVFRLSNQSRKTVVSRLNDLIKLLPKEALFGQLWIVEDVRIRVWEESGK